MGSFTLPTGNETARRVTALLDRRDRVEGRAIDLDGEDDLVTDGGDEVTGGTDRVRCVECDDPRDETWFDFESDEDYVAVLNHFLDVHPDSDSLSDVIESTWVAVECRDCGDEFVSPVRISGEQFAAEAYCTECADHWTPIERLVVRDLTPRELLDRAVDPVDAERDRDSDRSLPGDRALYRDVGHSEDEGDLVTDDGRTAVRAYVDEVVTTEATTVADVLENYHEVEFALDITIPPAYGAAIATRLAERRALGKPVTELHVRDVAGDYIQSWHDYYVDVDGGRGEMPLVTYLDAIGVDVDVPDDDATGPWTWHYEYDRYGNLTGAKYWTCRDCGREVIDGIDRDLVGHRDGCRFD